MNPEGGSESMREDEVMQTEHHPMGRDTVQEGNRAWRRKNVKIIARHFHIPFQTVNDWHRVYGKARPR